MPKYEIKGPDGQTYEVEAPEGASEQEIMSFVQSQVESGGIKGVQPQESKGWLERLESAGDYLSGMSSSAANTMTFGLSDKVAGLGQKAAEYLFGPDDVDLEQSYMAPKRRREQFEQQNPMAGFATSMVGAMANPINTKAGKWAVAAPKMLGKIGRGSLAGGLISGLQTAGTSEGTLGERAGQTAFGTGIGLGIGAAVPPLVKGATNLLAGGTRFANRLIKRASGGNAQATTAARKISEALERDQLTPQQAMDKIKALGPEARLIDVGPNTRALGFTVNAVPGKGKKALGDFLTRRQEGYRDTGQNLRGGQANRISKTVDDLIPENYYDVKVATEAERKFLGKFYEAAKTGDDLVDTSSLLKQLDDEIFVSKGSIKQGLQRIKNLLIDPKGHPEIDVQSLHQAKMAIDDFMQGRARGSIGNVAKGRIRHYQSKLIEAIEESGEAGQLYKTGRLGTAGQWRIDDALEEGSNFLRGTTYRNPRDLANYMAKLAPEETEAFKIGAAKAIKEKLSNLVVRQDAAKKVLDIPALEKKIKLAFGDEKTFQKYIKMVSNEKEMFKSYAKTLGGSETAERIAAMEDAAVDPGKIIQGMQDTKGGNWLKGLFNIGRGIKDAAFDPEPQSSELAKQLLSRNPSAQLQNAYQLRMRGQNFDRNLIDYITRGAGVPGGRLSQDLRNRR